MSYKRGEVYYIERAGESSGSEQFAGRPAIVVSNDRNNEYSSTLEVVYLTTQPKTDLPTHVDIRSTKKNSIALCEQVHSVSVQRVGDYISTCTDYEMQMVDAALMISLALDYPETQKEIVEVVKEVPAKPKAMQPDELVRITTERDIYKNLYEQMFERVAR